MQFTDGAGQEQASACLSNACCAIFIAFAHDTVCSLDRAGAAGGYSAGGLDEGFGAESATMGIFQLGIGPYIDASWTLSLIFLLKIPREVYSHLQSLRRSGREVRRHHTGTLDDPTLHVIKTCGMLLERRAALGLGCRAEGI